MITDVPLRCPRCELALESHSWTDANSGECRRCGTAFEFVPFPALTARPARIAAQPATIAADSVCFFHAENRAESVCDDCGRLLCGICAVPFMGRTLCPTCMAGAAKKEATALVVRSRVLYDSIALALAVVPLVMYFFTFITAPVALGLAIYGWNKPCSLVRGRGRWRLVLAGLIALAEITGWVFVVVRLTHLPIVRHR